MGSTLPSWPVLSLLCPGAMALVLLLLSDAPAPASAGAQPSSGRHHLMLLTLLAFAGAAFALLQSGTGQPPVRALGDALVFDGLSRTAGLAVCASGAVSAMLAGAVLQAEGAAVAEFLALMLMATSGALTLAMAGDLLTLFLGVEAVSMASYVLAGFRRSAKSAQEAALKYYLFGAMASACMVFGMALLWGEAGRVLGEPTFSLRGIGFAVGTGTLSPLGWLGTALLLSSLAFKVGLVPFHAWVPDVYQGAPTVSSAFFASTVKVASFVALTRLALPTLMSAPNHQHHGTALGVVALLSIVVGNLLALRQTHLKRFFAWSSVAHAGYALLGLVAACLEPGGEGLAASQMYLFTYCGLSLAAFGLVVVLERSAFAQGGDASPAPTTLDALGGTLRERPWLAFVALVTLFGMAGLPPTSGFAGKFFVLSACVHAGAPILAVVAALASVLGAYGYLRVLAAMLFERGAPREVPPTPVWLSGALGLSVLSIVWLGVAFGPVWQMARHALSHMAP